MQITAVIRAVRDICFAVSKVFSLVIESSPFFSSKLGPYIPAQGFVLRRFPSGRTIRFATGAVACVPVLSQMEEPSGLRPTQDFVLRRFLNGRTIRFAASAGLCAPVSSQ